MRLTNSFAALDGISGLATPLRGGATSAFPSETPIARGEAPKPFTNRKFSPLRREKSTARRGPRQKDPPNRRLSLIHT
ncbi:hypothetical protein, partial [Rubneribacter badeniensis]|uniref:hypothetical protein n=1 Tax=Rubneribacter badeniensis TaxID=2070688 RepID=UPI00195A18C0